MTKKNRNITSPIRSGFDYQDLWTLKLSGEWLLEPKKYKWIKIEANPTEESFFLDDIILLDKTNKYHLYQAKFKSDNNYEWTWDDLLLKKTSKRKNTLPSLINKWTTSFQNVKNENIEKAVLLTNGKFSEDIQRFISNNLIDTKKLKKEEPTLYKTIQDEFINEKKLTSFFRKFEFICENKNIDEVENEIIEELFHEKIYATSHGVNNLLLAIKNEARKHYTVQLTLNQIRKWCEFDNPKPLNETFEIPSDFQFFDKVAHKNILKDLKNYSGGVKVIYGKPGTGKSVYLSELSKELKNQNILTIKHHYHINPAENNFYERLNANRVIEAIKAQFKNSENRKYLGGLAGKNTKDISLRDFISEVALNLSQDKKNLVLLVDGLDHVMREKDINELKTFLDEIYYPQKGVWIIFGTQPQILKEPMLNSFFSKCEIDDNIELKGLNKKAVFEIINKNSANLKLPDNKRLLIDLKNQIFNIAKGNPLHLRYILRQLKNRFKNTLITDYSCRELIPYSEQIQDYYALLWNTLETEIKTFLLTFISIDFQFNYKQFIECISSFNNHNTSISDKFNKVEHLIFRDERNNLRIYHDSFKAFLLNQIEWIEQKQIIKTNLKQWLEKSKYENLKWAELKKLEFDLGNYNPIISIDRNWLIEAISNPRNSSQIELQLKYSLKAAIKKKNYAKAFEVLQLNNYYKYAKDYIDDAYELIWTESIKLNPEFINDLILKELPSATLSLVAEISNEYGIFSIIDEIIEILQERLTFQEYSIGETPSVISSILKVIPYDRKHKTKRIYDYIIKFRDIEISAILFAIYSKKLLSLGQKTKLNELLNLNLTNEEKIKITENCLKYDFTHKISEYKKLLKKKRKKSLLELIFLILQGVTLSKIPKLPDSKDFPSTIKGHGTERLEWTKKFHTYFHISLIYSLSGKQLDIKEWIRSSVKHPKWAVKTTSILFLIALKISKTMKNENKIIYKDIFHNINEIEDLTWPENRDISEFKYAFVDTLAIIIKDVILIKTFLNDTIKINKNDFKIITSTPFFNQQNLFNLILEINNPIFEKEVSKIVSDDKIKYLSSTINYFSDRSENYAKLSNFNALYKEKSKAKILLTNAANNFLGYGYRKDTYLFDVLESIEFCAEAGIKSENINNWIKKVIPMIDNVGDYTDGKETNHLPKYLAAFLSKYNKDLLYKFYFRQVDKEELYPAQDIFKYVIQALSFSKDTEIELATTALDKDSLSKLSEQSKLSKGASKSYKIINKHFGEINYTNNNFSSPHNFKEDKIDYSKTLPKNLKKNLNATETKWDFNNYIIGWSRFWLEKYNKQSIYNLVKDIVFENEDIKSVSGELLDILYPLAYEFDNDVAFKYLCFAQINDHGWDRYWTDKKKTKIRWKFLKEKYTRRYLEFFENTTIKGFSLSRSIEFFIYFDEIHKAQDITEAGVEFSEGLMADLNLKCPDWAKDEFEKVDEVDLLFQRLVWPSPLVCERAATAIGNLIANSSQKEEIYTKLLVWIKNWRIESIIAVGLLPIIKAFQILNSTKKISFIKIEEIINSIQANSIVIENLLTQISEYTNEKIKNTPKYLITKKFQHTYEPNNFFKKNIKTILAPIYYDRADEIEKKTGLPFIKMWSYNGEMIAKDEIIDLKSNHYFYGRSKNDKFLTGFSTKVSEIYRSAFLRVLHSIKEYIHPDFYLEYTLATLPVDLSFWRINSNRMPEYWPKLLNNNKKNKKKDLSLIQFDKSIKDLLKYKKNGNIIIGAEGSVCPSKGWSDSPKHSFTLIGFFYRLLGKDLPTPEEVVKEILHKPITVVIPTKAKNPLNFLDNSGYLDILSEPFKILDLEVYPIISRNQDLVISLWQYYKDKNQSFNIVDELRHDLKINILNNKWVYLDKDDNEIIIFEDWLEGLEERYEFEMPIPQGHQVLINETFINEKLKANNLRLGYILKTTYRSKENGYEKAEIINNFEFLNVSKILL